MKKRSIPLWIFLSVITFGICLFVWFYSISKETIEELEYESIDNAGLNLFYLIITFGLYGLWWNYKISTYLNTIERRKNVEPDFWAPLMSMTFGFVLHQSRINRLVAEK